MTLLIAISAVFAWRAGIAPDETSHLTMVEHHADHISLSPSEDWLYGPQRGHSYRLYSPVPYAVYVPFEWVNDAVGPIDGAARPDWFVTRLGGLVVAAAQFVVTLALVRRMCRHCAVLEITAVALAVNLVPQLRYIHAYVNVDGVTILAATCAFAVALRVLQSKRLTLVDATLVGLVLALIAHGRFGAFGVGLVLLGVFAWSVFRHRDGIRDSLRKVGVAIAIPMLLAGSFHLYVYNELGNRRLQPAQDVRQLFESTFAGEVEASRSLGAAARLGLDALPAIWSGMWARFVEGGELEGGLLWILAAAAGLGVVSLLLPNRHLLTPSGRAIGLIAVAVVVLTWLAMIFQAPSIQQGRHLLSAAVPALAGLVLGTAVILHRLAVRRAVLSSAAVWIAVLLGLDLWEMARLGT